MTERPVVSTYRLQLTEEFGFARAAEVVDYCAQLGVSHLYLSPILTARSGSAHGYDVVDPSRVSPALGGEDGLRKLAWAAQSRGLGLVVDIVPNHLFAGADNPDWQALLADGHSGEGGRIFDVDWRPTLPGAEAKVIVPVLGDHYGVVLYAGDLRLVDEPDESGRRYRIRYHEHSFPLSPESQEALERVGRIDTLTGTPGRPETWHRLHGLLEQQHYRLVYWRIGDRVVNYRRFFAISDLAAVRVEDRHVFDRTHAKILELVADGVIDGLRVDHPDGLNDPARYLERLERRSGGVWTVVEKILHPGEPLEDWAAAGTTGYEFCNDVLGLFVDPDNEERFTALNTRVGGDPGSYHEQEVAAKRQVLGADLASEVSRLGHRLWALAQEHLDFRDLDDRDCLGAVAETLVGMPVYRTYVDPETGEASQRDHDVIAQAIHHATEVAAAPADVVSFLQGVLTGEAGKSPSHLDFLARFQQLSGALMAKGVEDTVFYRYTRMAALNEVGGDPTRFGIAPAEFHRLNGARAERHPQGMLTTATHDTKRGEDVRLRIAALTEMPDRWAAVAGDLLDDSPIDGPMGLLLLQTLVGVWPLADGTEAAPLLRERLVAYAVKAAREAGTHTDWYDPSSDYEGRLVQFVDAVIGDEKRRKEVAGVATAAGEIAMVSGLAQAVLRTLSPGVPDLYRGNELWDDSLVDPDNRRPVDWERRRAILDEVTDADLVALWQQRWDGRIKLALLHRCLRVRSQQHHAFNVTSGYQPLPTSGEFADHVVAFARTEREGPRVVVVVPRLPAAVMGPDMAQPLGHRWTDTTLELPEGEWELALASQPLPLSGAVRLADVFAELPVAVLTCRRSGSATDSGRD